VRPTAKGTIDSLGYKKSYMRNRSVLKWMTLTFV